MNVVRWTDPQLTRISLLDLQLINEAWQVTQCEGYLKTGECVQVHLPFSRLPRYGFRRMIVKYAQKDNVYAVGLKIFDAIK